MTTINIPARAFAAALKCAAKGDVRYYINGVYLDLPKGRIVSTDGHQMFIGKIDAAVLPPVVVPRELIESALKSVPKRERDSIDFAVTLETVNSLVSVTIQAGSGRFSAPAVDGRFPEYERVVPREVSGVAAQIQPAYLLGCMEALNLYTGNRNPVSFVQHNGDGASLLTEADCLCVVMPIRAGDPVDTDWLMSKPDALAQAA